MMMPTIKCAQKGSAVPRWIMCFVIVAAFQLLLVGAAQAAGECARYYKEWSKRPDFKVLVMGKGKCWQGWSYSTLEEAKKAVLSDCSSARDRPCRVEYATNEKKYWSGTNKKTICSLGLRGDKSAWDDMRRYAGYVAEAKRRGLSVDDCRVAIGLAPLTEQSAQSKQKSDWVICVSALTANREAFATGETYSKEVGEAKRRGLSVDDCRVAIGVPKLVKQPDLFAIDVDEFIKTDSKRPAVKELNDASLCVAALVAGRDKFSTGEAFSDQVAEANRRGLSVDDCRVAIGVAPLNSPTASVTKVAGSTPPLQKSLSLTEICQQSLNSEKTDWSNSSTASVARKQADAMGVTVEICRIKLGLVGEQTADSNDTTPAPATEPDAITGHRVALVVGINDYENLPQLQKAVNDSRAVSRTLASIGYDVVAVENPDRRTLNRKLSELQSKIQPGDNALFYFAGHGVALGGENILIARDMPKPATGDEDLVRGEGFVVDDIVRRIEKQGAKTAFLVLDACRDNPFEASGTRSIGGTRGLEKVDTPSGVFVLYSAGIGQSALDRLSDSDTDPNSVFTRKLLPALNTKGLTLTGVAKTVQKSVADLAATVSHEQQPAYYDQIIGEVVINPR